MRDRRATPPAPGGWVRVRVALRTRAADVVRRLEALGVYVEKTPDERSVEGLVAVEKLAALAALDAVLRIEPVA